MACEAQKLSVIMSCRADLAALAARVAKLEQQRVKLLGDIVEGDRHPCVAPAKDEPTCAADAPDHANQFLLSDLREWAELSDNKECWAANGGFVVEIEDGWCVPLFQSGSVSSQIDIPVYAPSFIQCALQHAIRKRGWWCKQGWSGVTAWAKVAKIGEWYPDGDAPLWLTLHPVICDHPPACACCFKYPMCSHRDEPDYAPGGECAKALAVTGDVQALEVSPWPS